jgi:hypothetical protein
MDGIFNKNKNKNNKPKQSMSPTSSPKTRAVKRMLTMKPKPNSKLNFNVSEITVIKLTGYTHSTA